MSPDVGAKDEVLAQGKTGRNGGYTDKGGQGR